MIGYCKLCLFEEFTCLIFLTSESHAALHFSLPRYFERSIKL